MKTLFEHSKATINFKKQMQLSLSGWVSRTKKPTN